MNALCSKKTFSGSTIKAFALISMFVDHFAAGFLYRILASKGMFSFSWSDPWFLFYCLLRGIGRIAFPIFLFFLIEGFYHTRSKTKYLLRLFLLSLLSEIPFDLLFNLSYSDVITGKIIEFSYQNVFFTLFLSLLSISVCDRLIHSEMKKIFTIPLSVLFVALMAFLADLLQTDYGYMGILAATTIYCFTLFHQSIFSGTTAAILILSILNPFEIPAFLALFPLSRYNHTRGRSLKWFFYLFYPVHLMILAILCLLLKI